MANSRVIGQGTGTYASYVTAISLAYPGNVTSGNLLVIGSTKHGETTAYIAGDCTKSAGTATIGTVALDKSYYASIYEDHVNGIWSIPVTGTGSCTVTVGGAPAGSYLLIGIQEVAGADVTSSRVDVNTGVGYNADGGAPTTSAFNTLAGDYLFGVYARYIDSGSTTITPSTDYATVYENEDGTEKQKGSFIDRISASALTNETTDWTAPTDNGWVCCAVAYKVAGGGGGSQTTGAKYPTAAETVSEDPWLDNTWADPANIYGTGEASITATSFDAGDQSYVLKAYGFDFSAIPDGSTIDGVICRVGGAYYATAICALDLAQLLDTSRAKGGTNQYSTNVNLTTSPANYDKGSSTDLWGNALTAAWVKDSDFGVGIGIKVGASNNCDVYVDYITLEIYYTAPATQYVPSKMHSYITRRN